MLAKTAKIEELEIDAEEAKVLADASVRVAELYDLPIPSEKVLAWIGLANALGRVYGPRVAAVALRAKMKPKVVEGRFRGADTTQRENAARENPVPPIRPNGAGPNAAIFEPA